MQDSWLGKNFLFMAGVGCGCLVAAAVAFWLLSSWAGFDIGSPFGSFIPNNQGNQANQGSGGLMQPVNEAQEVKVRADLRSFQTGLEQYFVEYGEYPEDLEALVEAGFIPDAQIEGASVEYRRVESDYYTLSATLPGGESYSVYPGQ